MWIWDKGPGAGQQFSSGGTAVNGMFEDWHGSEPRTTPPSRDYIDLDTAAGWQAERSNGTSGYLLEWEGTELLRAYNDEVTIYDGAGTDDLYASTGLDTFIFESASAFTEVDTIYNFDKVNGDIIDISDVLTGFSLTGNAAVDFVQFTEASGDTTISIDADGAGGYSNVVILDGVTGLDVNEMVADGNLVLV